MSEWKECKLGEVAEIITKGTTPTTLVLRFTENYDAIAAGGNGGLLRSAVTCIEIGVQV
jgi:hypothetical protein